MEPYVIRGGQKGYERLLVLARDRWPDTAALLARAGVSPGMRCIDLGCGGGEVTLEIAKLVAPTGNVTGVVWTRSSMWAATRQGGLLVVEDADFDGWCCHPPNEGVDFFLSRYSQVLERRGGDHALGRKLYGHFLAAGIPRPHVALVQSAWTEGEGKTLAWSTLEASADAIVSEGIASQAEVTEALTVLERFTDHPHTLICGPRVFQLWSRQV
jgi:hypothetical protein